jgi:hypothetical protein
MSDKTMTLLAVQNHRSCTWKSSNPEGFCYEADGTTNAANYVINHILLRAILRYTGYVRLALRRERNLNSDEGQVVDLNCWGIHY